MTDNSWNDVDAYLCNVLLEEDDTLSQTLRASTQAGLPEINVTPPQGKFLMLLAQIRGATAVLEIGTLGGYSTIWLARGIQPGGRVVTLEVEPASAEVARANVERAGCSELVDIRVAPALETLPQLAAEGAGPFDLVFIDADKANSGNYLHWALELTRPGSVIVCDNVIRHGQILDAESADEDVRGTRAALELAGSDGRLDTTALQTVGAKGWDGFLLCVVKG
ncbi:MAG: O-methyltransferase [Nocardioidaceae bacterium]|nr:O-methyltransferase [Nocardioidaceae bacterium]